MAVLQSRQLTQGYAKETTRLSPVATPTKYMPWTSQDGQLMNEYVPVESAFGIRHGMSGEELSYQYFKNSLGVEVSPHYFGEFLYHAHGAGTFFQEATTGAYKHTFSTYNTNASIPTFTWFYPKVGSTVTNKKAPGCAINSYEISSEQKGKLTGSAEILGLREVDNNSAYTPTYTQQVLLFLHSDLTLEVADNAAFTGATTLCTRSFKMSYNNNIELEACGLNPTDVFAGSVSATVEFSGIEHEDVINDAFRDGTDLYIRATYEATNRPVLGTSTLYPMLRYTFAKSKISLSQSMSIDDKVTYTASANVSYSLSDAFAVTPYLQNEVTSY